MIAKECGVGRKLCDKEGGKDAKFWGSFTEEGLSLIKEGPEEKKKQTPVIGGGDGDVRRKNISERINACDIR